MDEKRLNDEISTLKALEIMIGQLRGLVNQLTDLIESYKKACEEDK